MLTQDRAVRSLPNGTVLFESDVREQRRQASGDNTPDPAPVLSGYIAWEDALVVLETSEGPITIRLRPDQAPSTTRHFRDLVEGGFYRDIIFHRVVNELSNGERFVVQVGDPTGTGRGGPGSTVDLEPSKLEHDYGVVSMARSGALDSGGSQFFICLGREGTKSLDGAYTAFGEVIDGRDALEAIALTPVGRGERPLAPPVLKSARTVPAPPRDGTPPARISAPPKDRIER
ncbi:MAG: hypothetical protein CMJ31_12215 [Phycisphaerae bacterium]|nr:hypothetical protein [Phycisphaerae bacterium]